MGSISKEFGQFKLTVLLAVTNSDECNITSCQIAKSKFNVKKTICRLSDSSYLESLEAFGEDNIDIAIGPENEVTEHLVDLIKHPGAEQIESFANGLPIISSDIGSMSEIIKNNYNGLHFKVGDSNDLTNKIKLLSSDENKCNQMSNNAYNDFKEHYTDQANYKLLIKLYKNIINDKKTKDS